MTRQDFDEAVDLSRRLTELGHLLEGRGAGDWHRLLRRAAQRLLDGPTVGAGCCAWCGDPLPAGSTSRRRFCSPAHRQADYRARVTERDAT